VQPLLPALPDLDPVEEILIEEHLVALVDEPPVYVASYRRVFTGVADEHPGHNTSRLNRPVMIHSCDSERARQPRR
jgi:hypothetical protein